MEFQLRELLPESFSSVAYGVVGIVAATIVIGRFRPQGPNLDRFPSVRSGSSWLGFWWSDFKYMTNAVEVVQQGYDKYKSSPFKILNLHHWMVILSDPEHIVQVLRAPDNVLSFKEGLNAQFNSRHTLGNQFLENNFHVGIVRSQLNRNIGTFYPEIRNEIVTAFDEFLDLTGDEWKSVPTSSFVQRVVCRASNRVFVGLPLCRDPDWIDLMIQYTTEIAKAGILLGMFPKFIRPLVVLFFKGITEGPKRALRHLRPTIEGRLDDFNEYRNDGADMPNDLLSWLMKEVPSSQLTPESLTVPLLNLIFASINSTSISFAHALFYLAANPQYIEPLREEVETIVEEEGWSKTTLSKMRKVDSFLRECQRLEGISATGISRLALEDFTFSDGTFIPKGTLVGVATRALQLEDKFYESPTVFKPFRFAEICAEDEDGVKDQLTTTSMEYLVFSHGKHACPGRFFAANVMKTMLAHIVVTYDIRLEDNTTRPPSLHIGTSILADPCAKVQFRQRVK